MVRLIFVLALWLAGCAARVVTETKFTEPSLPDAGIGKWVLQQAVDPLDDTLDMIASLPSEDWVGNRSGAVLHIACSDSEGDFEVQFVLHGVRVAYPTDKDEFEFSSLVMWRFDKQNAVSGEWAVSDDRKVLYPFTSMARLRVLLGVWDEGDEARSEQVQWAKDVLGHSKLFVRIRPSGNKWGKGDFLFDLRGAAKAVAPVRAACGW